MQNNIDKIVGTLTEGLSEQSVKEVCTLVTEVVAEQVEDEVKLLEAKVSSFLRLKLDELKKVARAEFESESENVKALKIYEAVKTLVSTDIDHEDMDKALGEYENKIENLEDAVGSMNEALNLAVQENTLLEDQINRLQDNNAELHESNQNLYEQSQVLEERGSLPFKSSESAVIITNDPDRKVLSEQVTGNQFLSEDVIRLSQLINDRSK